MNLSRIINAQNMSLSRIIDGSNKPWNDTTKLTAIYGIASSMKYLHSKNIIHRDLRPENIFFNDFFLPFIGCFYLSQFLNENNVKKKDVADTMKYLAPEIILKQQYSKSSDAYAFAIVVYEIFEGKFFFEKFDDSNIAYNVGYKKMRAEFTKKTPQVYKKLIESCWDDDPSKRPSFEQVVNDLENNKEFITSEVDEQLYLSYIEIIHESEQGIDTTTKLNQIFPKINFFNNEEEYDNYSFNEYEEVEEKYDFLRKIKKINLKEYRIIYEVNDGDFFHTFLIEHKKTHNLYAAKIYHKIIFEKFLQELRNLSKLNHPLILKHIGYNLTGFNDKRGYATVTEYMCDLSKILYSESSSKLLNETIKLIILYGIASAMKYLHSLDIIHRDLKPSNIFIDNFLHPKLGGFYFSKNINEKDEYENETFGTVSYMAPEIITNNQYTKENDVFAFSMIAYEIYNGKLPHTSLTPTQIIYSIIIEKKRPMISTQIPDIYKKLIESCWDDDPSKRPSFEQVVNDLENNKEFITSEVDEQLYLSYIEIIHESEQGIDTTTKLNQIFPKYQLDKTGYKKISDNSFRSIFEKLKQANSIESKLSNLNIKQINISDFKPVNTLGSGSYGKVFLIQHKNSNKIYAAKKLNSDNSEKSTEYDFFHELEILSKLKHPSILKLIGYSLIGFKQEPNMFIITEYISNGNLEDIISNSRNKTPIEQWDETMKLINIYGIASAMSYVHAQNILHLDLKPLNVLINKFLLPIVCDFGLSVKTERSNQIINVDIRSICYCSPEIIKNNEATSKSDVYSFGMLLYEMITNQSLYEGLNLGNIIYKISRSERPKINISIPKIYKDLINNCWNDDPNKRPSFDKIVKDLSTNPGFMDLLTNGENKNRYKAYIDIINNELNGSDSSKLLIKTFTEFDIKAILKERYEALCSYFSSNENYLDEDCEDMDEVDHDNFSRTYSCISKNTSEKFYATVSDFDLDISKKEDFMNEIKELERIDHPAIQKFIGFKIDKTSQQPRPVIINEYFPYKRLIDIIIKEGKGEHESEWTFTKKLINIYGISSALMYLNSHKIHHSVPNLKQILVDSNYYPKMTEIGFFTQPKNSIAVSKMTSIFVDESLFYLPPEKFNMTDKNNNNMDEKSDVYSLAIIIYEILTNNFPYQKNLSKQTNLANIIIQGHHKLVFNMQIPKVFHELIERCVSDNRPSLSEIVSKLENDPNFITDDVNKEEFENYRNILLKFNKTS